MDETLVRIKKDIVAKGVRFFDEIDQAQLAASAGIKPALCRLGSGLDSETLAVFVGVLFVTTGISRATGALSQYRSNDVSSPKGCPHAHAKHSVSRAVSISVDFADCGPSSRRWNRSYKERVFHARDDQAAQEGCG